MKGGQATVRSMGDYAVLLIQKEAAVAEQTHWISGRGCSWGWRTTEGASLRKAQASTQAAVTKFQNTKGEKGEGVGDS